MRRKSERVKDKSGEKKAEKSPKKSRTRSTRRRKKSSTTSPESSDTEDVSEDYSTRGRREAPAVVVVNPEPTEGGRTRRASKKQTAAEEVEQQTIVTDGPIAEESADEVIQDKEAVTDPKPKEKEGKSSVWQVKSADDSSGSEIKKLKLCIVRPTEQEPVTRKRKKLSRSSHRDVEEEVDESLARESSGERRHRRRALRSTVEPLSIKGKSGESSEDEMVGSAKQVAGLQVPISSDPPEIHSAEEQSQSPPAEGKFADSSDSEAKVETSQPLDPFDALKSTEVVLSVSRGISGGDVAACDSTVELASVQKSDTGVSVLTRVVCDSSIEIHHSDVRVTENLQTKGVSKELSSQNVSQKMLVDQDCPDETSIATKPSEGRKDIGDSAEETSPATKQSRESPEKSPAVITSVAKTVTTESADEILAKPSEEKRLSGDVLKESTITSKQLDVKTETVSRESSEETVTKPSETVRLAKDSLERSPEKHPKVRSIAELSDDTVIKPSPRKSVILEPSEETVPKRVSIVFETSDEPVPKPSLQKSVVLEPSEEPVPQRKSIVFETSKESVPKQSPRKSVVLESTEETVPKPSPQKSVLLEPSEETVQKPSPRKSVVLEPTEETVVKPSSRKLLVRESSEETVAKLSEKRMSDDSSEKTSVKSRDTRSISRESGAGTVVKPTEKRTISIDSLERTSAKARSKSRESAEETAVHPSSKRPVVIESSAEPKSKTHESRGMPDAKSSDSKDRVSDPSERSGRSSRKSRRHHDSPERKHRHSGSAEVSKNEERVESRKPREKIALKRTLSTPADSADNSVARKRRWGGTNKKPVLSISTDSLKNLIPEAKLLAISEVELTEEEVEEEEEEEKEEGEVEREEEVEAREVKIVFPVAPENRVQRTISLVGMQGRSPSPARHRPSSVLCITNLTRPFTVNQLKELLARTGTIEPDGFWTNVVRSKCYVQYTSEADANETRRALHGVRWPVSNPKQLFVDFARREDLDQARNVEQQPVVVRKPEPIPVERPEPRVIKIAPPIREWDLGKTELGIIDEPRERARSRDKERRRKHRSISPRGPPSRKVKKEEEAPAKLLDDLFRKTKLTPCIYWLPLTADQIVVKEEMRRKHMAEHARRVEEMRKAEKERLDRMQGRRGNDRRRSRHTASPKK